MVSEIIKNMDPFPWNIIIEGGHSVRIFPDFSSTKDAKQINTKVELLY